MISESASDDETVMLSLRVPVALKNRLASLSSESGATIQSIGRRAIEIELETREAVLAKALALEPEIRNRIRSRTPSHIND